MIQKYEIYMINFTTGESWNVLAQGENREVALQKFLRRKFVSEYFCSTQGDSIRFFIDKEKIIKDDMKSQVSV